MPFAIGSAARRAGMLLAVVGLVGSLLASPAQARHQEQAELSQVQDKLDAVAKVLAPPGPTRTRWPGPNAPP